MKIDGFLILFYVTYDRELSRIHHHLHFLLSALSVENLGVSLEGFFILKESVQFNMISFSLHWVSRVKLVFTENRKKRVSSNFSHFLASQQRKGRKNCLTFMSFE